MLHESPRRLPHILLLMGAFAALGTPASFGQGPAAHATGAAVPPHESSSSGVGGILTGSAALLTAFLTGSAALVTAMINHRKLGKVRGEVGEVRGGVGEVKRDFEDFKRDFINVLVTDACIDLIKRQGGFLSVRDLEHAGQVLRDLLRKKENIKVIRLHGNFADKDAAARLDMAVGEHSKWLLNAEQSLLDLAEAVKRLESTIDRQEERRKLLEELHKRYPDAED